jgi:hypothetical protein
MPLAMSPQHREAVAAAARRTWADPQARAARIEAMRLVSPDDALAIADACRAEPPVAYKVIAHDFGVSESTINAIALAHGIRRRAPHVKPRISLTPPAANWKEAA